MPVNPAQVWRITHVSDSVEDEDSGRLERLLRIASHVGHSMDLCQLVPFSTEQQQRSASRTIQSPKEQ